MLKATIDDQQLKLEVSGIDRLLTLKSSMDIPLEHITDVSVDHEAVEKWYKGLKSFGVNIPGFLAVGTFHQEGKRVFWDVRKPGNTLILHLQHEDFDELVIEVEDPDALKDEILAAKE